MHGLELVLRFDEGLLRGLDIGLLVGEVVLELMDALLGRCASVSPCVRKWLVMTKPHIRMPIKRIIRGRNSRK